MRRRVIPGEALMPKRGGERAMVPRAEFRSYYGRPVLKRPHWKAPHLPGYLYFGGLGRPERFLNMLRVLKPTSPMSVGSWALATHAGFAGAAAASAVTGIAPRLGRAAGAVAALTGPVVATYSGVLMADTAVPAW